MLTQSRLQELLNYNPKTGIFTRRKRKEHNLKRHNGKQAGCINNQGYVSIGIDYKYYAGHRLAWLYVHGYLPEDEVDHINRVKDDNRMTNLRVINHQCNSKNSGNMSNNRSGVNGAHWNNKKKRWVSSIRVSTILYHLKVTVDFVEAVAYRLAHEQALDWEDCDSCSPAFIYMKEYTEGK